MTQTISILIPSRKRVHRLGELLASLRATVPHDGIEVIVAVDEDDDTKAYFKLLTLEYADIKSKLLIGEKPKYLSTIYASMFKASSGDIICYCADDVRFETMNWDRYVRARFEREPVLLYYDADHSGLCPIHGFVSRIACERIGYLFPPGFEHGYIDQWLHRVYRKIDRCRGCREVVMDHVHWHRDPSLLDSTYRVRSMDISPDGKTCDDRDKELFEKSEAQMLADAAKLESLIESSRVADFIVCPKHPVTSRHPLYQSIVNHPPAGRRFDWDDGQWWAPPLACDGVGLSHEFCKEKSQLPWTSERVALIPTYPEYLCDRRQLVFVEDWATLMSPWVLNGKTASLDIDRMPHVEDMRTLAARESWLGVATHMKRTVDDVRQVLRSEKAHYVPLGLPMPKITRQRTDTLRLLWTNSIGGQPVNFKLRGGMECIIAFTELRDAGVDISLTILGMADRWRPGGVTWVGDGISDEELFKLHDEADVVLIPGVRIHSVAVARAMAHGCVVIGSDGWGYDEYITDGETGFLAKGQRGSWVDGVMREDYSQVPSLNETLVSDLVSKIKLLVEHPSLVDDMSKAARVAAEKLFSIDTRNKALDAVLPRKL